MSSLVILIIIWAVVVLSGFVGYRGIPSLGRRRLPPLRHRPDYAKIAELERELGMSTSTESTGGPFIRHSQKRPMPLAPEPEFQLPDPGRPLAWDRPPMFKSYEDYMTYLRNRLPPQE